MINSVKLKALLYAGLASVAMLTAFLICFFALGMGWLYSVSWGLFFGGVGAVLARTIYHLYTDDNSAVMWQVSIYGLVACLGWLGAILCSTYTWLFVWIAVITGMGLMLLGVRFINGWWLIREPIESDSLYASLENSSKYKFVDDDPAKGDDTARPLCSVDGKIYTIAEAEAEGLSALASTGRSYLKKIVKKIKKETK